MAKDYYKVLGIERKATNADIKQVFKKLARQYHPDVNPDNKAAEARFKEISEAYEVLGDEKKRTQYDQVGSFDFGSRGPQNPYSQNYWQNVHFSDVDLDDIFGDIFGFGGAKRGRRRGQVNHDFGRGTRQGSRAGSDIHWKLPISFMEAVNGTEKQILLSDGKKIKVKIPAGMDTGSKIRLAGKGNPGVLGGESGDLIIESEVKSHEYFKRENDDIHLHVDVSFLEALKGAKIKVPTISVSVELKIPVGSQSGQVMRLKGKGVKSLKGSEYGDQFIHLQVKYPANLSDKDSTEIAKIIEKYPSVTRKW